jgi:hypothetical protein
MTAADLTPGTRVVVQSPGWVAGQTGTVIEMATRLLNGHDCAVLMDNAIVGGNPASRRYPLCFYAHELAVEK